MRPTRTRAGSARSQARVSVPVVCGPPCARARRWDLTDVASPAGLEPATPGLGNRYSILLSYGDLWVYGDAHAHQVSHSRASASCGVRAIAPRCETAPPSRVSAFADHFRLLMRRIAASWGIRIDTGRFVADHTSAPEAFRRHSRYRIRSTHTYGDAYLTPEPHTPVSGFRCPVCASTKVRLATVAQFFFYLRCDDCTHVWSHPERRQMMDRRRLQQNLLDSRAS